MRNGESESAKNESGCGGFASCRLVQRETFCYAQFYVLKSNWAAICLCCGRPLYNAYHTNGPKIWCCSTAQLTHAVRQWVSEWISCSYLSRCIAVFQTLANFSVVRFLFPFSESSQISSHISHFIMLLSSHCVDSLVSNVLSPLLILFPFFFKWVFCMFLLLAVMGFCLIGIECACVTRNYPMISTRFISHRSLSHSVILWCRLRASRIECVGIPFNESRHIAMWSQDIFISLLAGQTSSLISPEPTTPNKSFRAPHYGE